MSNEVKPFLDFVLEDDNSIEHGGVAFEGETLRDFIKENGLEDYPLEKINHELIACGIKPIQFDGFSNEEDFDDYDEYERHYYYHHSLGWLSEDEYYDDGKEDVYERNR